MAEYNHEAHLAWIASQLAAITPFMRAIIPARVMEESEAGDYLAQLIVAGDVQSIARLEAMTDEQLNAEYLENQVSHIRLRELDDPSEYDVNDHESYYYQQWVIEELRIARDVAARYMSGGTPLTHRIGEAAA